MRREHFQRNVAVEPPVVRAEDLAHPAAADELLDHVAGELTAGYGLRRSTHRLVPIVS
jgi:hypothetical protein